MTVRHYLYINSFYIIDTKILTIFIISFIISIIILIIHFSFLTSIFYMNFLAPITSSIAVITSFLLLVMNPGVIYSDKQSNKNEKIYCYECKYFYPKSNRKMEHCLDCKICVCKLDHHCGVIGKCVGKYNLVIFFLFVLNSIFFIICFTSVFIYFILIVIIIGKK